MKHLAADVGVATSGSRRSNAGRLVLPLAVALSLAAYGCGGGPPTVIDSPGPTPGPTETATTAPGTPETTATSAPVASVPASTPLSSAAATASSDSENSIASASSPGNVAASPIEVSISKVPVPPDRDLFEAAQRLGRTDGTPLARTVDAVSGGYETGHRATFNIADLVNDNVYPVNAVLQLVSDSAYWYVDERLAFSTEDLKTAAEAFETKIRPTVTATIGDIWSPGVDNDPRLTVLHTALDGVAGYYGSQDEYPATVHPNSNQREIIYMDGGRLKPGTAAYLGVLAHEFQHAVHWNLDNGEEIWVNEGMSEVTKELAGYRAELVEVYLRRTSTPLNYWGDNIAVTPANYGASTLFLAYLHDHYGGPDILGRLAVESADGEAGVDAVLTQHDTDFIHVFKDWAVANLVDASEGKYEYPDRTVRVRDLDLVFAFGSREESLPQFGVQYLDLRTGKGDATIEFQGSREVRITSTDCFSGDRCWWSNDGDSIDSTLTRGFDLSGVDTATLSYRAWHLIESGWDYAYLEASDDGGQTWEILSPSHATSSNPVGNSFGPGYTGSSGGWFEETVDLSKYAGRKIDLRFEYITDDAVYLDGLLLDDIAIPEIGFMDDGESDQGWEAAGFYLGENTLPQEYFVQLVLERADGTHEVRDVALDDDRHGTTQVTDLGEEFKRAVVVVSPVTLGTHQPASYTVTASQPAP